MSHMQMALTGLKVRTTQGMASKANLGGGALSIVFMNHIR
jgi:hypothetical protein